MYKYVQEKLNNKWQLKGGRCFYLTSCSPLQKQATRNTHQHRDWAHKLLIIGLQLIISVFYCILRFQMLVDLSSRHTLSKMSGRMKKKQKEITKTRTLVHRHKKSPSNGKGPHITQQLVQLSMAKTRKQTNHIVGHCVEENSLFLQILS